jgi:hypothetical protein
MNNCLSCFWNIYKDHESPTHFDCCHPVTNERGPQWQRGDPGMVNLRTADVPISRIDEIGDCPTFKPI